MTLLDELRAVLAEGPGREAENRQKRERLEAAEEDLAQAADGDIRLQMILMQSKAIQQLTERNDQLELILLRVGIEALERIERLEQRP
jgi:hypothetical protein